MEVNAKEFASGQHGGVKIVAEYLDKPRRLIEGVLEEIATAIAISV